MTRLRLYLCSSIISREVQCQQWK